MATAIMKGNFAIRILYCNKKNSNKLLRNKQIKTFSDYKYASSVQQGRKLGV